MSDYLDNLYSELSPIVAGIGFNDGANKGFWRKQPRKKWGRGKGQWLFMGAKVRMLAKHNGQTVSVTGRVIGSDGTATGCRFLPDPGQEHLGFSPDRVYGADTSHIEEISAHLSENYLEGKGIDVPGSQQNGTGSTVADANIPNVEDMETAPATPDDFRLADEGVNSPEGKEQEAFANSPEGQEIARLVDETPDVATPAEISDMVGGNERRSGGGIEAISDEQLQNTLSELLKKKNPTNDDIAHIRALTTEGNRRSAKSDIDSSDERAAYGYGFTEEPSVSRDGKTTSWKKEDPSGEFTRVISREVMPDGTERWSAQDFKYDSRDNTTNEFGNGRGYYKSAQDAFESEGYDFDPELADEWDGLNDGSPEWSALPDGTGQTITMPNGAVIKVGNDGSYSILDTKGYGAAFGAYSEDTAPGLEAGKKKALEIFNSNPDGYTWHPADPSLGLGDGWEVQNRKGGKALYMKDNDPNQSFSIGDAYDENDEPTGGFAPSFSGRNQDWSYAAFTENMDTKSFDTPAEAVAYAKDFMDRNPSKKADDADNAIADIMSKINNGEDPGTVDDVIHGYNPSSDESDDEEDPFSKDEPSMDDLMDIESEGDLFDSSSSDLSGSEISKVTMTDLYDVEIGDILKVDGGPVRVTDREEQPDGSLKVTYEDEGGFEGTRTYSSDEMAPVATLSPKSKSASEDVVEPITPEDAAPSTTSAPTELPDLPDNQVNIPGSDIEKGDILYSDRGFEKGKVVDIRKDRAGNVEVRLEKNGTTSGWTKTDRRSNSAVKGEKASEVAPEPEKPNLYTDAPTANAAGFTESSRDRLRGMEAEHGGEMRQAYAKALANGRTSTVAQDIDGSWHMEKHDAFNGGILETKRFDSLQEALDEGNAFLENRDPKFDAPETSTEDVAEPSVNEPTVSPAGDAGISPEPPKAPKVPKTKKPTKKKPAPEEKQASGDEPTTPNDDASIFSVEGREDHGGDIGRDPDFNNEAARNRKIPFATDKDGNVLYTLDKKGKRVPVQDRNAILKAVLEDNKNAVVDKDGNIVFFRRTYVGSDGKNMTYEVLVHKNTGGKTGISVRFTNQDTGEVQTFIHHDERDSYKGLMGATNGPERLIDILEGTDANGEQVERKTATRGFNTEGLTDPHQRVEYFREQGRLLTLEETATKYMDGQAEIINTSLGAGGIAYGTKRQSEIMSLAEAIRTGDRAIIDERLRAMAGHFPLNQESIKALRSKIRSYLREGGLVSEKDLGLFVDAFSAHLTRSIKNPLANDIPYKSSDTRAVKVGMFVEWKNNVGEISRGRVVGLMERAYSANDSEYLDNAIVEFADGRQVNYLTTKNMTISADQKDETTSEFKPWVRGIELRRQRNMAVQFRDDLRARAAEQAEMSVQGGKVDDLQPGHLFYGKDGSVLGHVVDMQPIEGAGGKRGFAILIVDAEGNDKVVNVAAGEVRGPKA